MNKEEYNNLNSMMELERKNAKLKLELKRKDRKIKLLEEKLEKYKSKDYKNVLGGDELDLILILGR